MFYNIFITGNQDTFRAIFADDTAIGAQFLNPNSKFKIAVNLEKIKQFASTRKYNYQPEDSS